MPLVTKPFSDIITFTRASSATFVGSNGLIQSATTNAPRFDYDPVTLAAKGLLIEEQRTNLLTYSEQFDNAAWADGAPGATVTVNANSSVAPDGTITADTLTPNVGGTNAMARQARTLTASTTYAGSLYIKAGTSTQSRILVRDTTAGTNFADASLNWSGGVPSVAGGATGTWSVTPSGNGWYRVVGVGTSGATASPVISFSVFPDSSVGTGTLLVWGAQLEVGSFPTSYIPTVASQVTRSADVASVNTLSPWYNQSAGSIYVEGDTIGYTLNQMLVSLTDGTLTNPIQIYNDVSGQIQANVWIGGAVFVPYAQNSVYKYALGVETNNVAASINGASVVSDLSVGPPVTYNRLNIGNRNGSLVLNGHIRRITYYPRRLSNAELQALTA